MILIKLAFAIIFPTLLGHIIVSLVANKKGDLCPLERLAISYGIGIGVLTFIMFIMGAFLVPVNLNSILITCLIIFIYPAYLSLRSLSIPKLSISYYIDQFKSLKWYEWLLIAAISARIFYSYFEALIKPVQECDAFANWSLRAKTFFIDQGLSLSRTHGYFLGGYHIYYPINIPLFESWIYNVLGAWNDMLVNIIFPTLLLSLIIIFYCSLRRVLGRFGCLFSVYLLTTLPFLMYHSTSAYMDFPLSFYFCSSFILLLSFARTDNRSYLILSALLAAIASWTKNEGIMLALVNIAVLLIHQFLMGGRKKDAAVIMGYYVSPIILFFGSWSIFKLFQGVPAPPDQTFHLSQLFSNLYRMPIIAGTYVQKAFLYGNWNIAWFTFFVLLALMLINLKFTRETILLLSGIVLALLAYSVVYYLTSSYAFLLDGTTVNRNFLTFMPLVIYFICSGAFALINKRSENNK